MGVTGDRSTETSDRISGCSVLLLIEKMKLIPKTIGNRKRLCVRLRSVDKHHLRKSADRKAQISPVSGTNVFLICAFRSTDFLRWCLSSERNLTHNLFFYFQQFLVLIQSGRCNVLRFKCEWMCHWCQMPVWPQITPSCDRQRAGNPGTP